MNGKWTKENFALYDAANPGIWKMFKHFSLQAASKRKHYSARGIFHQVRWHTMMREKEGEYKLDAGWSSHYARKFMERFPQHEEFFETRIRRRSYHDD